MIDPSREPSPHPASAPDAALSRLLRSWEVNPTLPPGFASEVHHRIRANNPSATRPPAWLGFLHHLLELLQRPAYASTYVALGVLLGAFSGSWMAQPPPPPGANNTLQHRYVASIDPYQMHAQRAPAEPAPQP